MERCYIFDSLVFEKILMFGSGSQTGYRLDGPGDSVLHRLCPSGHQAGLGGRRTAHGDPRIPKSAGYTYDTAQCSSKKKHYYIHHCVYSFVFFNSKNYLWIKSWSPTFSQAPIFERIDSPRPRTRFPSGFFFAIESMHVLYRKTTNGCL